jgi:hypothetical protein
MIHRERRGEVRERERERGRESRIPEKERGKDIPRTIGRALIPSWTFRERGERI